MYLLIFLCLVVAAFAEDCQSNAHYNDCGSACPITCENYKDPPLFCIRMCVPGCHCDEDNGYVKRKDGQCVLPQECESSSNNNDDEKSCVAEPDEGLCRGAFPMYYYDPKKGDCFEFIYGGCGGNGNRYASYEECREKCSDVKVWNSNTDVCELPIVTGPCRALFHRYAFDAETGECKKFIYGGCGGNKNNFNSLKECLNTCAGGCPSNSHYNNCGSACPITCNNYKNPPKICILRCQPGCQCDDGYVKTNEGRCVLPEECEREDKKSCTGIPEGPCPGNKVSYWFNQVRRNCFAITGDCKKSNNRYSTYHDCMANCSEA